MQSHHNNLILSLITDNSSIFKIAMCSRKKYTKKRNKQYVVEIIKFKKILNFLMHAILDFLFIKSSIFYCQPIPT